MMEINRLFEKEKENIEFKEFWYWSRKEEDKNDIKKMDELLKDIVALLNLKGYDKKYLVIGKADKELQFNNYFLDREKREIKYFKENDFYKIKKDLVKKLLRNFDIDYLNIKEEIISFDEFPKQKVSDIIENSINLIEENMKEVKVRDIPKILCL